MRKATEAAPPRPIAPGDIVTAWSDALGEWTAAQVTDLDPEWRTAGVLDLDWSGPEPRSAADLGAPAPLRLTHHAHAGRLSHCNFEWLLPRGYRVIGNLPLLHDRKSNSYSGGWYLGDRLAWQRQWDRGDRSSGDPGRRSFSGAEIAGLAGGAERFPDFWHVSVTEIEALNGDDLAALFPKNS